MDKELKATQQILKILSGLDLNARTNVLSYVERRAQQAVYDDMKKSQVEMRIGHVGAGMTVATQDKF